MTKFCNAWKFSLTKKKNSENDKENEFMVQWVDIYNLHENTFVINYKMS